jgi:hypothetical protein
MIHRDPGNEWIATGEVGVKIRPSILAMLKIDGLRSGPATIQGIRLTSDAREILYLAPTLLLEPFAGGPLFEGSLRFSLAGRNFPAGMQLVAGISYQV